MLPLNNKTLAEKERIALEKLQNKVNDLPVFAEKVKKAQSLWDNKNTKVFKAIKQMLTEMCVGNGFCNYCEGNKATDIEHIYPKSFFPEYTFEWENYLLACGQCNQDKLDKCFVIDETGEIHVTKRGQEPIYKTIAFINPRKENPYDFLWLDLSTGMFDVIDDLPIIDKHKAEKTIEILKLDKFADERKSVARDYMNEMARLVRIMQATDVDYIRREVQEDEKSKIDENLELLQVKEFIKQSVKQYIQKHRHPSVWYAIKTIERKISPKWQNIFAFIPEALTW